MPEKKYELTPEKEEEIIKIFNPNWDGNKNMELFKYIEESERRQMIKIINEECGYSIPFLETKSNDELYEKILRLELIAKYSKKV